MQITTYVGASRNTTKWNPRHEEWEEFAARFEEPVRTPETLDQYKRMSRDEKGHAKDVGGFVGGILTDHKRSKKNIQRRTLITLDADFAKEDLVLDVMSMGYQGLVYSTHSHTKEKPKLRIVIPMESTLTPDEYPGVVNYFAHVLGVDQFDPTSDEPERLMYWPSCPQDGDYVYEKFEGDVFNGIKFLEDNPQWADSTMWELSARKRKKETGRADKAQDPRTKSGVIGAFCRVFDIHQAIEAFLPDIYEPVPDTDRYTYLPGSTSNGVHTHNDLWAYSHHGTDPAGSLLCNAWDLVRIHLFEGDDNQMYDWAGSLPEVMQEVAITAFRDDDLPEDEQEWIRDLQFNTRGRIIQSVQNYRLILDNDPEFKGMFRFNELSDRIEASPKLFWRKGNDHSWSEQDMAMMYSYCETQWHMEKISLLRIAFDALLARNRYNPIQEYLTGLEWDGVPRVEEMLIKYLGAEDSEYTREVTRKWMAAGIARVMRPGIQFDHMLILTGPQGIGKSTLLKRLAGPGWFNDSIDKLGGGKDAAEQVRGYWIVCVDELSALKKIGEAQEQVKNFITRTTDTYRPAYGRYVVDIPRQCVFAGTTNEDEFLRDHTGARRFWTVKVTEKHDGIWAADFPRDQLWAEAMMYYMMDEPLYLSGSIAAEAEKIQEEYTQKDDMVGAIEKFLRTPIPKDWEERSLDQRRDWYISPDKSAETMMRDTVCGFELWCELMGNSFGEFPKRKQMEIGRAMNQCKLITGSKTYKDMSIYGRQRVRGVQRCSEVL